MSAAKHYLKLTKGAIEANDPELALEYVDDVLEADKNNYFAYIFQGKSNQLLERFDNALKAFEKAISIQPDNLLGWKGYWQTVQTMDDFDKFLEVLADYLEKLIDQGASAGEVLRDTSQYLAAHDYKNNIELQEIYLASIVPGSKIYDLIGNNLGSGQENLNKLIDLILNKNKAYSDKVIQKERLRLPKVLNYEQQAKLNLLIWPIYENCKLSTYFDEFLNICNDDETRVRYQELYLRYKYDLVKLSPDKSNVNEVKAMCEDLVLLRIPSYFIWNLHFDFLDVRSPADLNKDEVIFCIKNFRNEGLGLLLYAFINSELSPFDPNQIKAELASDKDFQKADIKKGDDEDQDDPEDVELLLEAAVEDEIDPLKANSLTADEVLSLILEGFKKSSHLIFANRIIINHYIHLREYSVASDRCKNGIKMLADFQRSVGADLSNSREDIICSLAVVYTHFEAPKNFGKALELYDRILSSNETNKRARIGKGLILMEKGKVEEALQLLESIFKEYPEDPDVLMELGWSDVQLGNHHRGRDLLLKAIPHLKKLDLQSCQLRAKIHWRIAKSFLLDSEGNKSASQQAHDHLIQSLKEFKTYAPSFTLLGTIYLNHYGDKVRAQKCFYKAFELDVAEVVSGRYLVDELTFKNEWEVAEILCTKIVESESARRVLNSEEDKAWPYRVLGCSALNKQDDAKAVEWLQTALRMTSMDFECWFGLGEAYYNSGRLDAAQKVFERALEIKEHWPVIYLLGKLLGEVKEYDQGIEKLNYALKLRPDEECIINALFRLKLDQIDSLLASGYFGRVLKINQEVIHLIKKGSAINPNSHSLWLSLSRSLQLHIKVQDHLEDLPIEDIKAIFGSAKDSDKSDPYVAELDDGVTLELCVEFFENKDYITSVSFLRILALKAIAHLMPNEGRYVRSINFYNLGLAYLEAFNLNEDRTNFRGNAIKCFKKAIQLEGKNSKFWVGLGNAYSSFSPQISQHCFIKATAFETKDGDIWNNLAALYLKYGDHELAQQAYMRSQSVAPDQPQSWLGHALTAKANDEKQKSFNLFNHAYITSNGRSPLAQLLYALSILEKRVGSNPDSQDIETAQEFSIANFAIQSYLKYYPNDVTGLKIALTISERCKTFDTSVVIGKKLSDILEADYEKTESERSLQMFINTKSQLGRVYLALERFDEALEESETVLNLVGADYEDEEISDLNRRNALSSRVVIGLCYFYKKDLANSISQLKSILSEYNKYEPIVQLTTQILNAFSSEETKQAALDQLFSFIEDNEQESSLVIVLTLGAIALKDDLEDILPAVKDELNNLKLSQITADTHKAVPRLLEQINKRLNHKNNDKIWERNAFLFPSDFNIWKNINQQMALKIATLSQTKLTAYSMSNAYVADGQFRSIQRGILLNPDNQHGWKCFQNIVR